MLKYQKGKFLLFTIPLIIALSSFVWLYSANIANAKEYQLGDVVDSLDGVAVYYNGKISHVKERNLAPDGYNIGLKWQCVEFVKRYYYEYYNHKFPNSYGHAKDFFNKSVKDGAYSRERGLNQYKNGSQRRPQKGDLIIFDGSTFNPYGHVAIISAVFDDKIEIIQQNPGPSARSRISLKLTHKRGLWFVEANGVLGWLRKA